MKKNLKMTPEGTKDFLFAECSAMDYICTSIEKVFVKGGFKRVITPALEFYDVFSIPSSGISQESMFKTTDNKGRLLVARPDSTLPIARMVMSVKPLLSRMLAQLCRSSWKRMRGRPFFWSRRAK